jgi:hypothetical protein
MEVVFSSVVRFHPERGPRPAEQARVSALSAALRTSQNLCDEVLGIWSQAPAHGDCRRFDAEASPSVATWSRTIDGRLRMFTELDLGVPLVSFDPPLPVAR